MKVEWVSRLPKVTGYWYWGFDFPQRVSLFVAVCAKGSTVLRYLKIWGEKYTSIYPNLAPRCTNDSSGKLVEGPIFIRGNIG